MVLYPCRVRVGQVVVVVVVVVVVGQVVSIMFSQMMMMNLGSESLSGRESGRQSQKHGQMSRSLTSSSAASPSSLYLDRSLPVQHSLRYRELEQFSPFSSPLALQVEAKLLPP